LGWYIHAVDEHSNAVLDLVQSARDIVEIRLATFIRAVLERCQSLSGKL
jgi:hypothetical protein